MANDGDSLDTNSAAVPVMGVDAIPGTAKIINVDGDGHLQVDVLSGGGGGTQYDDGDARGSATGTLTMGDDGTNIQSLKCDVNGVLAIQDNGGAITVDGTVAATQSGTWDINDISGTVSLPTGAATAANQLPDGHNVTVDNAAGASAVNIQDGGNSITVDGTIAATQSGTWDINDISGTVSLPTGAATSANQLPDGHNVTVDNAAGGSAVNIQDGGNSITIDGTVTASNTAGDVAHDSADSGNPLKIGAKAVAHSSNPTAVAAGDRTDIYANRHGIPFVIGGHPNVLTLRANYTTAQTDTAIVTIASGKIVVTRLSVTVDNACSVDVQCRIGFGTATTPTTTGVVLSHPGIAAGSGVVEGNGSGILGIGADNEDLRITCEVPTGGSIDIVVSYYTVES